MRIALVQEHQNDLYLFHEDRVFGRDEALALQDEMIDQNLALIRAAGESGADLALTSEAINYPGQPRCLPGLSSADLIASRQDALLGRVSGLAREYSMCVVVGAFLLESDGELYNEALVYDRRGDLAHVYRKNFLAGEEASYLRPGRGFPIWESEFGRVGIGICWDMQFPETARACARQGADLILCPTWGWEWPYAYARAYENGVYVAAAMAVPAYKDIEGLRLPSQVISPMAEVLAEGPRDRGGLVVVDLPDLRSCDRLREGRIAGLRSWERRGDV